MILTTSAMITPVTTTNTHSHPTPRSPLHHHLLNILSLSPLLVLTPLILLALLVATIAYLLAIPVILVTNSLLTVFHTTQSTAALLRDQTRSRSWFWSRARSWWAREPSRLRSRAWSWWAQEPLRFGGNTGLGETTHAPDVEGCPDGDGGRRANGIAIAKLFEAGEMRSATLSGDYNCDADAGQGEDGSRGVITHEVLSGRVRVGTGKTKEGVGDAERNRTVTMMQAKGEKEMKVGREVEKDSGADLGLESHSYEDGVSVRRYAVRVAKTGKGAEDEH